MKIDIKVIAPYIVMIVGFSASWGMLQERLEAVESKTDTIAQIQTDVAIIKEKIMWMEEYLIKTREVPF
jgi:hypothetical protein